MSNEALVVKLAGAPTVAGEVGAAAIAEESCKIVGMPEFYPERNVGADYVAPFMPAMEQILAAAGAKLAVNLSSYNDRR